MTKLAPEWVRTSDPVIRSPARYHWTTAAHPFAFLRIGELVVASSNDKNTLTLDNVCLDSHGKNVLISFSRFKHSKGRMHSLSIQQRTNNCPVEAFHTYISLRGAVSGYLFLDHMGKPITI